MNILETITERTRERVREEKRNVPAAEMRRQAEEICREENKQGNKPAVSGAGAAPAGKAEAGGIPAASAGKAPGSRIAAEQVPLGGAAGQVPGGGAAKLLPFEAALRAPGLSFICEVKKASPSKGLISPDFPYMEIARQYDAGGASAISCLTEPYWFQGSDRYLQEIVSEVSVPVLRKDFTCDEYMIWQAKVLGASAVLLICSVLDDAEVKAYLQLAHELNLSALVEAYDVPELERAQKSGAKILGVNNRNLKDFEVDITNSTRLRAMVDPDTVFVSESGIRGVEDMRALYQNGTDAVLIGELLMRAENPQEKLAELKKGAEQ